MRVVSTAYSQLKKFNVKELSTERLNLVKPFVSNLNIDGLYKIYSSYQVSEHNIWEPISDVQEMKKRLQLFINQWENDVRYRWLIKAKDSREIIGDIVIVRVDERWNEIEIGFNLAVEYQRQGIMTEALKSVLKYVHKELNFMRVTAYISSQNNACINLVSSLDFFQIGCYKSAFRKGDRIEDIQIWQKLANGNSKSL